MANIDKLNFSFTDGQTTITANHMNSFVDRINKLIDAVGVSPTQTVATPTISISGTTATISCETSSATIYYTIDDSTPTTSSTQYSSPITLSGACTIKAIAVKSGMNNSSVASQSYMPSTVATPVISISGNSATITCATSGAQIRYTLDGTTPTANSTLYSSAIALSQSCTIKAIAIKSGMTNSSVASKSYSPSVQPVVPTMVFNTTAKTVALSATSGLTIKYSTDGGTPATTYSSPINVANGATIKAISTNGTQSSPTPKIGIKFNAAESSNILDVSSMLAGFETQAGVTANDNYRYIRIDMSEYPVGTVFSFIDAQNQPIQARWSGYVDADGNPMKLPGTQDNSFQQNKTSREKLAADEKYLSVSFATSLGDNIGVFVGENPEWGGEQTMEFVTSEVGTIRYTTNGSEPTSSSSAYSSAITPVSGTTYKAAVYNGSTLVSETETIQITS